MPNMRNMNLINVHFWTYLNKSCEKLIARKSLCFSRLESLETRLEHFSKALDNFSNGLERLETRLEPRSSKLSRIEDRGSSFEDRVSRDCQLTFDRYCTCKSINSLVVPGRKWYSPDLALHDRREGPELD